MERVTEASPGLRGNWNAKGRPLDPLNTQYRRSADQYKHSPFTLRVSIVSATTFWSLWVLYKAIEHIDSFIGSTVDFLVKIL